MSEFTIADSGEYADIALADGRVYICAETDRRDGIAVYRDGEIVTILPGADIFEPENGGFVTRAYYPRIAVNPSGQIAVAYQFGVSICLSLLDVRDDVRPTSEIPFGTEMVCVAWLGDRWRLAYIARIFGVIKLVTHDYSAGGVEMGLSMVATDCTQGVSRILPDGRVLTMDEDQWAGNLNLSRAWQAGSLLVGQANTAPARCLGYVSVPGSVEMPVYRIFDGLAYRPRAVETSPGRWTVIAAGTAGIRVVDVPPFVVDEPAPIELDPVTRPIWAGWFKTGDAFDPTGAWRSQPMSWCHVETPQAAREAISAGLQPVCNIDVYVLLSDEQKEDEQQDFEPSERDRVPAIWAQGPEGSGSDVWAVQAECRRALSLLREIGGPRPPILAYVDDASPDDWPALADWCALQCYLGATADVAAGEARFRWELSGCPEKPIVLVAQAWDRRTTANGTGQPLAKVEALQAVWPRLVNDNDRICGVLSFAWGRAGGSVAYPSLADLQARIVRSIPSIPSITRIDQPVDPPEEPPVPTPQPYPDENGWWNDPVTSDVQADYAEANKPHDLGLFKWFARTAYDIASGLTKEASWSKHRNEMRGALGLPPL